MGCTGERPRRFENLPQLFSENATAILSGVCIYEFWEGSNGWGLVKKTAEGKVERLLDFHNLKAQFLGAGDQAATQAASPSTMALAEGDWICQFPEQTSNWKAGSELPEPVLDIYEAAKKR